MARPSTGNTVLELILLTAVVGLCTGSYIITSPRKWTSGEPVQICLFNVGHQEGEAEEGVEVRVKQYYGEEDIVAPTRLTIPQGKSDVCHTLAVRSVSTSGGNLVLNGRLGGKNISLSENLNIATTVSETFIQTDKFLYMPGQKVQFRVLTITGPYLKVYTGSYPLIWIESPSGSRIAQWNNVENPAGLIHQEFQLIDEPEEGTYKIYVESNVGNNAVQTFKVEEFVLPRFEVTIEPPPYILGQDTEFSYKVCAKYTYGQPVKGNVTFTIEAKEWHSTKSNIQRVPINGCHVFNIDSSIFKLNEGNFMARSVGVSVTVEEAGTGQEAKAESQIDIQRQALKFEHTGKETYSKPNLPYTGEFKVKLPSGAPAANIAVNLCVSSDCKNLTTDNQGLVQYIYPKYENFNIRISSPDYPRVANPDLPYSPYMYESSSNHYVRQYHSPSSSALIIIAPEVDLKCQAGEKQEFTVQVLYSASKDSNANFTIQLVSRGQIQDSHTAQYILTEKELPIDNSHLLSPLPPPANNTVRGVLSLPITVPLTSSPTAKVVVWYTRGDGEVVSDAKEITIKKCLNNPVTLAWSRARAEPGEAVSLTITASPDSLCSLDVVDKSVELLSSGNNKLTLDGIFDVAERAMVGETENTQINDQEYCERTHPQLTSTPRPPRPPFPIPDPVPFFGGERDRVEKRSIWRPPGRYNTDQVDAIKMFEKSGLFVFTDLKVETRPCTYHEVYPYMMFASPGIPLAGPPGMPGAGPPGLPGAPAPVPVDKQYFLTPILEHPEPADIRSYFPETWLWQLSFLQANGTSSQELTLPHTITEWVGKTVCVHQQQGVGLSPKASIVTFTPFFIDLTLPPSVQRGEILPVKISVFNYLDESLPVKVVLAPSEEYDILDDNSHNVGNGTRSSCIVSQDKTVHTIKVRPKVVGDVNLTVEAFVDGSYPQPCGPEYVLNKRDHIIKPIRVELEGFPQENTWTKYICTNEDTNDPTSPSWTLEAPINIVEDSARGWVTAVGDLLGPTLDNLGSLVRMPYGCGEQNMINFAPNIFVLQYLEAAGLTKPEIAEKAIKFMKAGYQRELNYRHKDGSFSAFGMSDDSGSTWLTAFVLKSFAQAQQFIPVDSGDIDMSRVWLKSNQMENGCFMSKGKVLHKEMKGGVAGSDSAVPLTAYVLISLLEAGELTVSKAVTEAAFCLVNDESNDPYTLALKTYALGLAQAPEAKVLLTQLLSNAKTSTDGIYWDLPSSDSKGKKSPAAVETTAYALLAMATIDPTAYVVEMQSVVKWISSKRNGNGGFVSTQDTVVALQSLAKFEVVTEKSPIDVMVITSFNDGLHTFHINETNKLLLQRVDLPSFPVTVAPEVAGDGCALVQAVLRYNIPDEDPSTAFTLRTTTETPPDDACVTKRIKVCASYTLPDLKSNMAVIEVNLVSGYIPVKADLKQVVGYGTGLIKRYEVDGRKVTFYIDEFSPEELCVAFKAQREVDVEDAKPGTVRVYDYYDPDKFVSERYVFPPNDECVGGSEIAAEVEALVVDIDMAGAGEDYTP